MKCNPVDYPIVLWIKLSFVFAFTTSILLTLASFTGGFMTLETLSHVCLTFALLLAFALGNICVHVFFKVENPIKSPIHVKLSSFGLAIVLMLAFHFLEKFFGLEDPRNPALNQSPMRSFLFLAIQACIVNLIVLLWLYFLMSEHIKVHHQLERSRLERSREEAVNLMLRQQIQPHFLFNALTTLKSLIKKDTSLAEIYLLQLSDFLRISIATVKNGELATIGQEIKLCQDYLQMQKMRFGDAIVFHIEVSDVLLDKFLPIFSIQPLVDNVLKHNNFTTENPVHIFVEDQDDWIVVRNNKSVRDIQDNSNGSGIRNLKKRYGYLSDQGVDVEETDECFTVRVKIVS